MLKLSQFITIFIVTILLLQNEHNQLGVIEALLQLSFIWFTMVSEDARYFLVFFLMKIQGDQLIMDLFNIFSQIHTLIATVAQFF